MYRDQSGEFAGGFCGRNLLKLTPESLSCCREGLSDMYVYGMKIKITSHAISGRCLGKVAQDVMLMSCKTKNSC